MKLILLAGCLFVTSFIILDQQMEYWVTLHASSTFYSLFYPYSKDIHLSHLNFPLRAPCNGIFMDTHNSIFVNLLIPLALLYEVTV